MAKPAIESLEALMETWFSQFPEIDVSLVSRVSDWRLDTATRRESVKKGGLVARRIDGGVITYSKNVFIPVSRLCRNRCLYCNFRRNAASCSSNNDDVLYPWEKINDIIKIGLLHGCKEGLLCGGEEADSFEQVRRRIRDAGVPSGRMVDWMIKISRKILSGGMLPHSNIGVITNVKDLARLAAVNASMGLMLESASKRLMEPGQVHEHSPGKEPRRRLEMIRRAGELGIPFTTGILVGIGETLQEIVRSLLAIRALARRYHHVQEVIIQGLDAVPATPNHPGNEQDAGLKLRRPSTDYLLFIVAFARLAMPPEVAIQVPPNLVGEHAVPAFLHAGASDLGGISPVTADHVNPGAPWPAIDRLKDIVVHAGFTMEERAPVYPTHVSRLPEAVRSVYRKLFPNS